MATAACQMNEQVALLEEEVTHVGFIVVWAVAGCKHRKKSAKPDHLVADVFVRKVSKLPEIGNNGSCALNLTIQNHGDQGRLDRF